MMTFTKLWRVADDLLLLVSESESHYISVKWLLAGKRRVMPFLTEKKGVNAILSSIEFIFVSKALPNWRFYLNHNPYATLWYDGPGWKLVVDNGGAKYHYGLSERGLSDFIDVREDALFVSEGGMYVHS